MSNDEKFVQWLKITIACFVSGVALSMLHDIINLLKVIANK